MGLAMYERWTYQYQKDAQEAEAAAAKYSQLTAQEAAKFDPEGMHKEVAERMKKMGVDTWAAAAAAPYNNAYAAYDKAKASYNGASIGYALRAKQDAGLAHQLMTYSNQFRLQGNDQRADEYKGQSQNLMTQADKFKGLANTYSETA